MDHMGDDLALTPRSFALALNNRNGFLCGKTIAELGSIPELVLLHPKGKATYDKEICDIFPNTATVRWDEINASELASRLESKGIEILLSINFGYIFPSIVLNSVAFPLNLHTGLLPWCRGSNPNVWSIIEQKPAGVTLHRMTCKVDKGNLIASLEVPVEPHDTGKSLYEKLEKASVTLINNKWPDLISGEIIEFPPTEGGSVHRASEMNTLSRLHLNENSSLGNFIDRLRALTFPPYKNAFFVHDGKRYYVEISIQPEEMDKQT